MIDSLPDHLVFLILSNINSADQWLLRFVSKQFKNLIPKLEYDPRRERIFDIVLEKALNDGGLSTVRFLWSINKKANIWLVSINIAIKYNHDEIVNFLLDNKCKYSDIHVFIESLKSNNIILAKKLYTFDKFYMIDIILAIILSNSIELLEWIMFKIPTLIKYITPRSLYIIQYAINSKVSIGFMKKLLSYMPRLNDSEIECLISYCIDCESSHIIKILRNIPSKNEKLIICAVKESNIDILEEAYPKHLNIMLKVPIHTTNDFHGFLRSKGHIFDLDMNNCIKHALIYKNTDKIKILMKLQPDVKQWLNNLKYVLKYLEIKNDNLKLIAEFMGDRKIAFEIMCFNNREKFDILSSLGGYCTEYTFKWSILHDSNLYIEIWNRLDEKAKLIIKTNQEIQILYTCDIYLLEFFELQDIIIDNICIYYKSKYFTKDLVEFCLKRNISHIQLLNSAITHGAYDIIEMLAPLCTYRELLNMSYSNNQNIKNLQRDIILKKTPWILKPLVFFF